MAVDSFAEQAFAAAAGAYSRTSESWEHAVHAAIASLFDFLAERPAETEACVDDCAATPTALAALDDVIAQFTALLEPGFVASSAPPPPVVAEAIGGGIYEVVRCHVLERRLDLLPDAVPDAAFVALAPFLGVRGAVDFASAEAVRAER